MIDLKIAKQKVDSLINGITKESFEEWLLLDQLREQLAFINEGYPLKFSSEYQKIDLTETSIIEPAKKRVSCFLYNLLLGFKLLYPRLH